MIACVRHYLVVVTDLPASRAAALTAAAGGQASEQQQQQDAAAVAAGSRPALVQVYDLRNKLLAGSLQVPSRLPHCSSCLGLVSCSSMEAPAGLCWYPVAIGAAARFCRHDTF